MEIMEIMEIDFHNPFFWQDSNIMQTHLHYSSGGNSLDLGIGTEMKE